MAAQNQAEAIGHRPPLFAKFGFNIYRKDVEDAISGAMAHPWATVAVVAALISAAILVLVSAGGITPNSVVYLILGIPVAGMVFLVLALVMEMKVKTLLPIVCVLVAIAFVADGGSSLSHYWMLVVQKHIPQSEEQQMNSAASPPPQQSLNAHSEYETIAQSVCTSMAVSRGSAGWTFAVKRQCNSITEPCEAICGLNTLHDLDKQSSKKRWSCLGAIHVYGGRPVSQPSTASNPSIGFKVYWSPSYHTGQNCGPNYCCCLAAA